MAVSLRILNETVTITWDHGQHRIPKGTVIDVPPGSALEQEIGAHRLDPAHRKPGPAPAEAPAESAPAEVPAPKAKPAARDSGGKDTA